MLFRLFQRPDPDAGLVTAARAGDLRAFDALVYRYQGHVRQFVRARLDCAVDADDVAQEVFVSAWRELHRFQERSRFKTWLFGIAVHACAEAARRHVRLQRMLGPLDETAEGWEETARTTDPSDWTEALAEKDAVQRRLAHLPEAERRLLELYYFADLNLPEISRLLDVNLSTLKYRFYQAHRRLRSAEAVPRPAAPVSSGGHS